MKSSLEKILIISCLMIASLALVSCGKDTATTTATEGNTITIVGSGSSN